MAGAQCGTMQKACILKGWPVYSSEDGFGMCLLFMTLNVFKLLSRYFEAVPKPIWFEDKYVARFPGLLNSFEKQSTSFVFHEDS